MLISSRRVGERFDIYAPDKETIICSLTVTHISSQHDIDHSLMDVCAILSAEVSDGKYAFDFLDAGNRSPVKVHAGDKFELLDKDKGEVICEIIVIEIKEHQNEHFYPENGVERGRGARIDLGANSDNNICIPFYRKKY